ncbi:MAG: hypothetical protein KDC54_09165, partial [Lewinella sp.]|nr:hypothetical protein [Lewinella sp.]
MAEDKAPSWTYERLLSLAPDTGTIEQARRLFFARRWRILEGDGEYLWGEYETAYGQVIRAAVRLEPPLFRCSCQARRKPCKHSLALVLLFLNRPDAWRVVSPPPDWAQALLRTTPQARPQAAQSPKADQGQSAKRLVLMDQGVEELDKWLRNLLRGGLAQLTPEDDTWESIAARMVDSKLGSIARRIRLCRELFATDEWPSRLLGELGLLYLFVQVWQRKPSLGPAQKRELLQVAGWNLRQEQIL